ncbi:MAG: hypothetical protein AAFW83_10425 [Pseudomonadota bacterium]
MPVETLPRSTFRPDFIAVIVAMGAHLAASAFWAGQIGAQVSAVQDRIDNAVSPMAQRVAATEAELIRRDGWMGQMETRAAKMETRIEVIQSKLERDVP